MYNLYTYLHPDMYNFGRFLYTSALICIICIHIHRDMYTFSQFLYISALICIICIHIQPILGIWRVLTTNQTTHAESDGLPDESDPRSPQARSGYNLHRYVQTRHLERHKPPPHSEVSSQNPENSNAAMFQG